ncbi:hypothetical protein QFC21_003404 [Naganishia friedmannii]|uniref:Uncharacterized protein n=1 Tax=Naganishia friedmannii TaxID=89922 RepID=A0ACC2VP54_9TREE|nr:hypothetical protein QFC21_003404 [Naganishia friedmannii]
MEEQTDIADGANADGGQEIMEGLTRFTLGDYHSGRLARHQRSETSSPSAVSNSDYEEDDEDEKRDGGSLGKKIRSVLDPARQSTISKSESTRKAKRVLPTSISDEEAEDDLNDVATFKEDWHASGSTETGQSNNSASTPFQHEQYATQSIRNEERDPVASRVPNEIIMHILRYISSMRDLKNALLISRAWCQCTVPMVWTKPTMTSKDTKTISDIIKVLRSPNPAFHYGRFVRRLNFAPLHGILQDAQLIEFAVCSRLERLVLSGSRFIGSRTLGKVLGQMKELVAIDLAGVTTTNDEVLKVIANTCKKLQGINLTGCNQITDEGLVAFAEQAKHLRRIKLAECSKLTDRSIISLAHHCPLILEFDLQNLPGMTDKSMREVWSHSTYLRELRLTGNESITDDGFPRLKTLPDNGWNYATTPAEPAGGTSLQGREIDAACRNAPKVDSFAYLRTVDLTGCTGISDEAIASIIAAAPKIRALTLAKCVNLTDAAIDSVAKLGKQLHYLHAAHLNQITDPAVCTLARSCTRMRYLDLAGCELLTDMSVFEIAQNMTKLRRIGLVKVTNITDQAIYALVDASDSEAPLLERVHLSFCDNLSVGAITHLLKHIPKITHLSLTGVSAFRDRRYQTFCRSPPAEFNAHQRAAFCVFSGKGVSDLRESLLKKERAERATADDVFTGLGAFGSVPRFRANSPATSQNRVATYGNATLPEPPVPAQNDPFAAALGHEYNIASPGLPLTAGFSVNYRSSDGLPVTAGTSTSNMNLRNSGTRNSR